MTLGLKLDMKRGKHRKGLALRLYSAATSKNCNPSYAGRPRRAGIRRLRASATLYTPQPLSRENTHVNLVRTLEGSRRERRRCTLPRRRMLRRGWGVRRRGCGGGRIGRGGWRSMVWVCICRIDGCWGGEVAQCVVDAMVERKVSNCARGLGVCLRSMEKWFQVGAAAILHCARYLHPHVDMLPSPSISDIRNDRLTYLTYTTSSPIPTLPGETHLSILTSPQFSSHRSPNPTNPLDIPPFIPSIRSTISSRPPHHQGPLTQTPKCLIQR
ncbi:hypothetical protein BU23DRAFT_22141 [Bimuria novae-zelandiae CBS 107.79]|uniref:Uncharacterized protein n=1 Tax=Bimuria novae-zelandiae CBS 107.79 TaxID=1447943 RepID=A0A6A5UMK3_9PLEO|nr:hypothetical protein BU23DRAFT_22141 [Bimuria novae-zelandiae CBS 107.79]